MPLTIREFKKLRADLLAEIVVEITGLKTNQLPAVSSVTDQHLFVIADKTTGDAFQATERQLKDAIAVEADFKSCVPTTMPTNLDDGDVYWPEVSGTYTNFKDSANAAITVSSSDVIVYFIYNGTYFTKRTSTIDLSNYYTKQQTDAIASKFVASDDTENINFVDTLGAIGMRLLADGSLQLISILLKYVHIYDDPDNLIAFADQKSNVAFKVTNDSKLYVDTINVHKLNVTDLITLPASFKAGSGLKQFIFGAPTDIMFLLSYGQSNSVGAGSTVVMTTTQIYDSIMFNGGVRPAVTNSSSFTSFVPLIEGGSGFGESPLSGCAETFISFLQKVNLLDYDKKGWQWLCGAPGVGGQTIAALSKGDASGYYNNITGYVTKAKTLADASGKKLSVPVMFWTHGGADIDTALAGTTYAAYTASLNQLIIDVNTDVKAITGQVNNIFFVSNQENVHSDEDNGRIFKAQFDMMLSNPSYTICLPVYVIKYELDNAHYIAEFDRINGAYYGYYLHKWLTGSRPLSLYPRYCTINGNDITIKFHVPVPPLKFDGTWVDMETDFGFRVYPAGQDPYVPASTKLTLSNITIISDTEVKITCSASPAGGTITYARINFWSTVAQSWIPKTATTPTNTGNTCQMIAARGNLRDSQGNTVKAYGFDMHNYCLAFALSL